jgi:hypothetical protein
MSRSSSGSAMGIARKSPPRNQGRKSRSAVQDKASPAKTDSKQSLQVEWEEDAEGLEELAEISGMLDKPAPERSCDAGVRRRIEMLREERQLQQALTEVFDF